MTTSKTHLDALEDAARRLHLQWEATSELWRDRVQQDFAERHYVPWEQEHRRMAEAAAQLAAALAKAQRSVK